MHGEDGRKRGWGVTDRPIIISRKTPLITRKAQPEPPVVPVDGRTLRRLKRFRAELKSGVTRGNRKLLPFEVVVRVQFLLDHGETAEAVRKLRKPPRYDYDEIKMVELLKEMDSVCEFSPEAYEIAGIRPETIASAGLA